MEPRRRRAYDADATGPFGEVDEVVLEGGDVGVEQFSAHEWPFTRQRQKESQHHTEAVVGLQNLTKSANGSVRS